MNITPLIEGIASLSDEQVKKFAERCRPAFMYQAARGNVRVQRGDNMHSFYKPHKYNDGAVIAERLITHSFGGKKKLPKCIVDWFGDGLTQFYAEISISYSYDIARILAQFYIEYSNKEQKLKDVLFLVRQRWAIGSILREMRVVFNYRDNYDSRQMEFPSLTVTRIKDSEDSFIGICSNSIVKVYNMDRNYPMFPTRELAGMLKIYQPYYTILQDSEDIPSVILCIRALYFNCKLFSGECYV